MPAPGGATLPYCRGMRRWLPLSLLVLASSATPLTADAQERPAAESPAPNELPKPPDVEDPMLTPMPRAQIEIATWQEALVHVRARSSDLHVALAEVERAEGQWRVALAGALPSLNVGAAYTHNLITKPSLQFSRDGAGNLVPRPVDVPFPDYLNGSATLVQPIFAPRAWYAIGTARRTEQAAQISVDEAKRKIAIAVASAVVSVVTSERIAELNRLGLLNALRREALAVRRNALGSATGVDVVRARQDVQAARTTLVAGDEALRQAREALGLALGLPNAVGVSPNTDLRGLEADASSSCKPLGEIDARPDVAALQKNLEVARRARTDVKLQFSPTVNLQSAAQTTTVNTGAAPNTTWNIQAVLSVPLFEGGARYGNLRVTGAQELQAAERLEAQRRVATIEVARARRAVSVAEDRQKVAAAARDLAAENDRLTRASYQEGRGTSLELVVSAQALREAEIQLALRDFDVVQARVQAVLALSTCPW